MKKAINLAIFSVSAGAGHVRAAQAIKATAERHHPEVNATHIDVMDLVPDLFRKLYADSYIDVVEKHPTLWGYLYKKADREKKDSPLNKLRRGIERLNTHKFDETIAEIAPDVIVCTHFLPAELLSRQIGNGTWKKPVWCVVTDFDIHSMWVHPHLNGYFAAADEIAARMVDRGLERKQIHVTGIPIMPVFGDKHDRAACAKELGLDPKLPTFLMMSGGAGLGGIEPLVRRLGQLPGKFQIIALAGKNVELLGKLQTLAGELPKGRLLPHGFTTTIEKLMAAADVAITKPGGLTTSECLAMGLPMLVVSPIPGQEERNADYLLENGAAWKAYDAAGLEFRVQRLLEHPERLELLRKNAKAIARPRAANDILARVLGELR